MPLGSGKSVAQTSFGEAVVSFREFLSDQGLSTELVWVFREDVIFQRERTLIKIPVPSENESRVNACYELGQKRAFGVNLHAFCLLESRPCCYLILPGDDVDAQYLLMSDSSLKCSARAELREAEPISGWLRWRGLKSLSRKSHLSGPDGHIPSRHSLLPEYRVTHGRK